MNPFRDQIRTLPQLIRDVIPPFTAEAGRAFDAEACLALARLHAIGCGDSYFAAVATGLAFEQLAGLPFEAHTAMAFARYKADFAAPAQSSGVIGISVSGGVSRTIEGVLRARTRGLATFAVTSSARTPIAQAAARVVATQVPDVPNAAGVQVPGARSYFASLVMLYLIAIQVGQARGHLSKRKAGEWRAQLAATADAAEAAFGMCDARARRLAAATRDAREFVLCGAGPNYATALFGAAKLLEATGDPAIGQDVEEWAHLQYFAKAVDTPTFLISAGERDASRAAEVRTAMRAIGRRVVDVTPQGMRWAGGGAKPARGPRPAALPYAPAPEVFAPLVAAVPLMLFAAHRAELLGEPYFRGFGGGRSIADGGGISRIRTSEMVLPPDPKGL